MVKTRRGWYLVDIFEINEDDKKKDKKTAELQIRQAAMVKRCDGKITRHRLQAEQREAREKEELLRAQKAIVLKQRDVEVTHRLGAELSRRKNEEIKCALKLGRIKSSSPSKCALNEARSHLIEEKIRLEANQAELSKFWHQDVTVERLQQAEAEKKKQNLRVDLQNQLMYNHRRIQKKKKEETEKDRVMMERAMRKVQEEDARMKKRKDDDAILLRAEMAASLAAKNAWERKYKEVLKDEDERIACIIAEKETRQEKLLNMETEFRATREATLDKAARKFLTDVCKKREREKISDDLYQEEQKSKWTKEPARLALRKQYTIAKSLKEMTRQQKAIAERKAKDEAIDAAFARYLSEEREKNIEKQRKHDDAHRAKKIQYGEELKEAIINNKVSYVMNLLERQSEIRAHEKNINQLIVTSVEKLNDKNDNNEIVKKEKIDIKEYTRVE